MDWAQGLAILEQTQALFLGDSGVWPHRINPENWWFASVLERGFILSYLNEPSLFTNGLDHPGLELFLAIFGPGLALLNEA